MDKLVYSETVLYLHPIMYTTRHLSPTRLSMAEQDSTCLIGFPRDPHFGHEMWSICGLIDVLHWLAHVFFFHLENLSGG